METELSSKFVNFTIIGPTLWEPPPKGAVVQRYAKATGLSSQSKDREEKKVKRKTERKGSILSISTVMAKANKVSKSEAK